MDIVVITEMLWHHRRLLWNPWVDCHQGL